MLTREMYLSKECTHQEYYQEIARETNAISLVTHTWTKEVLTKALEAEEHLNSIPLREWDNLGLYLQGTHNALMKRGEVRVSQGCRVCILKAAARIVIAS